MSAFPYIDITVSIENRSGSILLHGKGCLGKNKIQLCHNFLVLGNCVNIPGRLCAQTGQYLPDFLLFLEGKLLDLVVQ